MSVYYNMAGTTNPSFKIGRNGPTIFQGTYTPSANNLNPYFVPGIDGDLFIRNGVGTTASIFVYTSGDWLQKADWILDGNDATIGSNVGIGVSSVAAGSALSVNGTIDIQGLGNGIYFPDGTFQNSSAQSSAAGTDGDIQFNQGGSFGASSYLRWDNANRRLGIGTTAGPFSSIQYQYTALESTASYVNDTTQTVIDSFKVTEIRSALYYVQITDETTSHYQLAQISVVHNGLNAYKNEYGIVCSSDKLGDFDVLVQGLNVNLLFTPVNSSNKTMKVNRTSMAI
jgi:hypothetical protein